MSDQPGRGPTAPERPGRTLVGESVMDERSGAASTHGSSPARSDDQDADLARAWAVLGRVHERNAHLDPNETFAEVTAEVEAVRQELYERRRAVR